MIFENVSFWGQFLAACNNIFVKGVVLAIAMDTFLGCLRAAKYHKWNSSVGIDGGIRKAGMLVSVFFLVLVDMLALASAGRYATLPGADADKVKCVGAVSNGDAVSFYQLAEAEGWTKDNKYMARYVG